MADVKTLGDQLVELTVQEVQELAKYLKETYNIQPAVAVQQQVQQTTKTVVAEKTNFDVVLKSAGANKLTVVKLVKDLAGLGLKESKDLVDNAPKVIKEGLPKSEAENMKNMLLNAGAEVELK
jgi:large subunit ribosomal protein L7/L12